jgi:hypothetical protein
MRFPVHLMEGIQVVAGLYKDRTLQRPQNYSEAFPNQVEQGLLIKRYHRIL